MDLDDEFARELADLSARDRLRQTRPLLGADRAHPRTPAGKDLLSFCSNDYLGLAGHPDLALALARHATLAGVGSSASRLVSGETPSHQSLETALAHLVGLPSSLLFPTGYLANIGVLTALAGPSDLIASDASNHASIIDGCRLSRAKIVVYPHLDAPAAEQALSTPGPFRRRLLVTESLFSMDGDRAPLAALATAAARQNSGLVVDEAHALGTLGSQGSGLCAELGIRPTVLIGTLGKAFASLGGFAAGSTLLRSILVNKARSFIYSTGSPAPIAAAAEAAVAISIGPEGDERRRRARVLADQIRNGLGRIGLPPLGQDIIIPIILGVDRHALQISALLQERDILIPAIRPPTVPEGTSRLRVTISAGHTPEDAKRLLDALSELLPTFRGLA